jgi:hypothetical protein
MKAKKSTPTLHPYGPQVKTGCIGSIIVFLVALIMFIGGLSIFSIYQECCIPSSSRGTTLPGGSVKIVWQLAVLFFVSLSVTGFIVANTFLKTRVEQGRWLVPPEEPDNSSPPPISMTTGRYLGRAIIALLFMISAALGTVAVYSLLGFLTGGAIAFLLRVIQDFALLLGIQFVGKGEIKQRAMMKYLEREYGTVTWQMFREARKDTKGWREQVRTQQGLEVWAEATCKKLGYPPFPGRIERKYPTSRG